MVTLVSAAPVRAQPTDAQLTEGSITDDDYPPEAARLGSEGTVLMIFNVQTDGRVEECRTFRSSGSPLLDMQSCALVRERFRYTPARDARGNPVVATKRQQITWRLPDTPAPQLFDYTVTFTLNTDGSTGSCTVTGQQLPGESYDPCPRPSARFIPATNASGAAVARTYTYRSQLTAR